RRTAQTADTPMGLHNGLETETDGGIHPTVCAERLFVRRGVGSRSPSMREVFCIMSQSDIEHLTMLKRTHHSRSSCNRIPSRVWSPYWVVDMAAMLRFVPSILIASLLAAATGCSGGGDIGKGYNSKSGDLGAFILSSAPKFGVRVLTTNGLPHIPAKWRYKEGSDEFQLFVEGNYFPQ